MPAGTYNITLDQGSDYSTTLQIGGQDLDGYGARGEVRPSPGSDQLLASFTCTVSGGSSTGGTIVAELTHKETKKLPAGTHAYDIEVFNTSTDKVVRLIEGTVTVRPGVTKQ